MQVGSTVRRAPATSHSAHIRSKSRAPFHLVAEAVLGPIRQPCVVQAHVSKGLGQHSSMQRGLGSRGNPCTAGHDWPFKWVPHGSHQISFLKGIKFQEGSNYQESVAGPITVVFCSAEGYD